MARLLFAAAAFIASLIMMSATNTHTAFAADSLPAIKTHAAIWMYDSNSCELDKLHTSVPLSPNIVAWNTCVSVKVEDFFASVKVNNWDATAETGNFLYYASTDCSGTPTGNVARSFNPNRCYAYTSANSTSTTKPYVRISPTYLQATAPESTGTNVTAYSYGRDLTCTSAGEFQVEPIGSCTVGDRDDRSKTSRFYACGDDTFSIWEFHDTACQYPKEKESYPANTCYNRSGRGAKYVCQSSGVGPAAATIIAAVVAAILTVLMAM